MTVKNRCVVSRVRRKTKNIYYVDRLAVYKQNKPNSLMHQQPRKKRKPMVAPSAGQKQQAGLLTG